MRSSMVTPGLRGAWTAQRSAAGKTFCAFAIVRRAERRWFAILGKPRSAYTPRPCFARSETHSCNPAYKPGNYVSVVLRVCYFAYGFLCLPTPGGQPVADGPLGAPAPSRSAASLLYPFLRLTPHPTARKHDRYHRTRQTSLAHSGLPVRVPPLLGTTSSGVGTNSSISSLRIRPGP